MPNIEKLPAGVTHEPGPDGNWKYRNFHIVFVHPPIPIRTMDYGYYHDDYDGADDAHDTRHGNGASVAECVKKIDERYEQEELEDTNPDWGNDRNAHLKGLGDKPYVAGPKEQWAICSEGVNGFAIYKFIEYNENRNKFKVEGDFNYFSWRPIEYLVAIHPTKELCEAAFKRAQELEKLLRPLWQAAFEYEQRVKQAMLDDVWAEAKLEKQLRPLWQQAIEFKQKVKNYMLDTVWAEAKK